MTLREFIIFELARLIALQTPQEQVAQALRETSFCLDDKDTNMNHVESFSWPSLLDLGKV
ncbi:hypothetical protein NC652_041432 [Populus alba x Populus x berolinensis]|nr:hypothetical protein NC652_041432 [Populus alba x Populus x berolinensis]